MLKLEPETIVDLEVELTTLCNAHCQLCYRNYTTFKTHYPKHVSRDLNDVITQLKKYPNLTHIRLVGSISEPTLYKHLFDLIGYIKSRDIIIEICTNGDTHNPNWWKELSRLLSVKDKVYFTICGCTQEMHEKYRRGTRLNKILMNADAFRSEKKNDYAQCIRFAYNSEDLDSSKFKDMVSRFSNVYMTETFLHKASDNYVDKAGLETFRPNLKKISEYLRMDKLAQVKFNSPMRREAWCKSWENRSQQIDINGNIYPCYLFLEASKGAEWDGDYSKILKMEYEVCKYCDNCVVSLCKEKDLHYII